MSRQPKPSLRPRCSSLWIGRERRYGRSADSPLRLTDERIMALLYDRRGVLWVGTMSGGLDRLDLTAGTASNYRSDPDDPTTLPAKGVMSLYQDRQGNLWVGTFGGGLASIERACVSSWGS